MPELISLLIVCFFLWAQLLSLVNGFRAAPREPEAPKNIEISVIDEKRAQSLFIQFANNKDIPFRYPVNGCYVRAHQMARIADAKGITMGKIFAEGDLHARVNLINYEDVSWGWHVATVVYV